MIVLVFKFVLQICRLIHSYAFQVFDLTWCNEFWPPIVFYLSKDFAYKRRYALASVFNFQFGVLVNLLQLIETMHNICKVWGSNPEFQQQKFNLVHTFFLFTNLVHTNQVANLKLYSSENCIDFPPKTGPWNNEGHKENRHWIITSFNCFIVNTMTF